MVLLLSLILKTEVQANQKAQRSSERDRNSFAAERAELMDRVMNMKGYREYAPLREREEEKLNLEVEASSDTPEGFIPYT